MKSYIQFLAESSDPEVAAISVMTAFVEGLKKHPRVNSSAKFSDIMKLPQSNMKGCRVELSGFGKWRNQGMGEDVLDTEDFKALLDVMNKVYKDKSLNPKNLNIDITKVERKKNFFLDVFK